MGTYANRTCSHCGIRKPQPNMYQREIYVETAKSQTGISGATMVGLFAGNKRSGSQFRNWLFNNGQRTYKRKKNVWLCGVCAGVERPAKRVAEPAPKKQVSEPTKATPSPAVFAAPEAKTSKWKWWVIGFVLLMVAAAIDESNGKSKKSQKQPTTNSQTSP